MFESSQFIGKIFRQKKTGKTYLVKPFYPRFQQTKADKDYVCLAHTGSGRLIQKKSVHLLIFDYEEVK